MNRIGLWIALAVASFFLGALVELNNPIFKTVPGAVASGSPVPFRQVPSPDADEFGGPPYDYTFDTGQLGGQDFDPSLVKALSNRVWLFWDAGRAVDPEPQLDVRMKSTDGKRLFFIVGANRPEWHNFHHTPRGAKVKLAFVPHKYGGLMVVPKVLKAVP